MFMVPGSLNSCQAVQTYSKMPHPEPVCFLPTWSMLPPSTQPGLSFLRDLVPEAQELAAAGNIAEERRSGDIQAI